MIFIEALLGGDNLFYTYIVSCRDGSLYTGYTTDIKRRVEEHKKGVNSKYTRAKGFSELKVLFLSSSKSKAMKLEYSIKQLDRKKKLMLIEDPELLKKYLEGAFEYTICDISNI
jgi:putative endonuclease